MRWWALIAAAIAIGLAAPAAAEERTVERFVEFRDGTVLRLAIVDEAWKVTVLLPEGRFETRTIRLSSLQQLTLTAERVFEKKRPLLLAIQQLGADEFVRREQAQADIVGMGPDVRPDLETALESASDPEVIFRLKAILEKWPGKPVRPSRLAESFDTFSGEQLWRGDAGEGGIAVQVNGKVRRLARKDVAGVMVRPPDLAAMGAPRQGVASFRRIFAEAFPRNCIEEGFETTPEGRRLRIGENVERLFIRKGFTLSTSVKTSYVSVNDWQVQGKTRGLSCATHNPLFTGQVTIRFCIPGREDVPAGVTYFGCWIAAVMPDGTYLHAYDIHGREIGQIHTEVTGHEFMGMHSSVPIHTIRVVPNLKIDPDFTLDDFIFTPPQSAELAHPEKFTVHFADGERILCNDVGFAEGKVYVRGLPAGLPDRSRPVADLVRVIMPDKGRPERPPATGVYLQLRDGSVLYGAKPMPPRSAPVFARRPGVLNEPEQIIALWSAGFARLGWPAKSNAPMVWDSEKKSWQPVRDVKLAEAAITWTAATRQVEASYFQVSQLVLREPPADPKSGGWRLRTIHGEELVLSGDQPPLLSGQLSQDKELSTSWQRKALKVPVAEIVSISHTPTSP